MATNYPTSLDTLTNPTSTDSTVDVDHASQHANANDAIEALQTKLGTGASTASANTILKGTGSGASAFGQLIITDIDATDLSGADGTIITGTAGTTGNLAQWNADGDLVDASFAVSDLITASTTNTLTNKTIDGDDNTIQDLNASSVFKTGTSVAITNGGTGQITKTAGFDALSPTTTKGDIIISDGSNNVRLGIGTDDFILKANSAQATGVEWVSPNTLTGTDKLLGAGPLSNTTYYTIIVPWQNPADTAVDVWTNADSLVTNFYQYSCTAGVLDGSVSTQPLVNYQTQPFTKDIIAEFDAIISSNGTPATNGTEGTFFGFTDTASVNDVSSDTFATADTLGFYIDNSSGNLYARTSNGGTNTDTQITGVTISNSNTYRIEFTAGSEALFYVNGNLGATITTNLPDDSTQIYFGFGCKNATNTYYVSKMTSIAMALEK